MRPTRLLYLMSFFAPIAFLIGYIVGAPRPAAQNFSYERINTRAMPVSHIDFYRNETSLIVQEAAWIRPNTSFPSK